MEKKEVELIRVGHLMGVHGVSNVDAFHGFISLLRT